MNIIKKLSDFYWRYVKDPVSYAKHLGVTVGENTEIYTRYWSSEPFLIKIGRNVQVTDNVHFFTHGGEMSYANDIQILILLVK